jgi:hypothetical protein
MNVFKYIVSSKKALWPLAGAASGAVSVGVMALGGKSWGTINILGLKTPDGNAMFFPPGCFFGFTIAILLFFSSKIRSFWRSILLIGMSGIAHYVAFETAFRIANFLNYRDNYSFKIIPAGFLGGAIGAAILGGSFYLLYPIEARWRFAIKFIGFGAIFGTLLFFVFGVGEKTNFFIGYSLLYVPWQAAVAYCLSLFYAPDQENKAKLPLQEQP